MSILAAPAAQQASTSAPAKPEPAPPKPKLKPLPLPAQKIEKKTKAKEPEPSPAQADSTGDGQYSGPLSPYASYGQAARQGQPATEYQAGVVDAEAQKRMIINARDIYITLIDPLIKEGIEYPAVAQRRGWEGRVILHFIVGPDGYVSDIQVAKSSGFRMLDMAAIKHIQSIKFPPPPYPDLVLPVPVTFRLEEE